MVGMSPSLRDHEEKTPLTWLVELAIKSTLSAAVFNEKVLIKNFY